MSSHSFISKNLKAIAITSIIILIVILIVYVYKKPTPTPTVKENYNYDNDDSFYLSNVSNIQQEDFIENYPQPAPMNVMYSDANGNLATTTDLGLEYLTVTRDSTVSGNSTVKGDSIVGGKLSINGFANIKETLDNIYAKISAVEGRAGSLEGRTGNLEGRAGNLEGRAGTLEGRAGTLEGRAGTLEGRAKRLEDRVTDHDNNAIFYDKPVLTLANNGPMIGKTNKTAIGGKAGYYSGNLDEFMAFGNCDQCAGDAHGKMMLFPGASNTTSFKFVKSY